jgi:hypothetical protein
LPYNVNGTTVIDDDRNITNAANASIGGSLTVSGMSDFRDRYSIITTTLGSGIVDCTLGNYFVRTLSGSETITFINPPASGNTYGLVLEIINGGAGPVTWANNPKWPCGAAPTLTTGASNTDVLVFITRDGGTTWRATLAQKDSR